MINRLHPLRQGTNTKHMETQFYRLEYNERQEAFHHERQHSEREHNTHGWVTVMENMTNDDMMSFDIFLEFATGKNKGWSASTVKLYAERWKGYIAELKRMNRIIIKTTKP